MNSVKTKSAEIKNDKSENSDEKDNLPASWQQIHGAIWLIGIAILFWQGWWWPGILILVAISSLTEAGLRLYLNQAHEQKLTQRRREMLLPEACPNCGGPLNAESVTWKSDSVAACPFCGTSVKATPGTMPAGE